jgi:glycine/D-amino acid oxidase-like deaminating enzyme
LPTPKTGKSSKAGIYPKLQNGEHHVFLQAEPEVYILNGLGGAGMTLSFGLAEECFAAF